jgi:hypothetical protein
VSGFVPGLFALVRTFAPKKSEKIAAKVGKNPFLGGFFDGEYNVPENFYGRSRPARTVRNILRPKISGLKVRTPGFFCHESLYGQNFSARNFKNRKIFRSKVEKSKNFWRESWKKCCQFGN